MTLENVIQLFLDAVQAFPTDGNCYRPNSFAVISNSADITQENLDKISYDDIHGYFWSRKQGGNMVFHYPLITLDPYQIETESSLKEDEVTINIKSLDLYKEKDHAQQDKCSLRSKTQIRIDTHTALKTIYKYLNLIYKVKYNGADVYVSSYKYDYLKSQNEDIQILLHKVPFLPKNFFGRSVDFTQDEVYGWSVSIRVKITPCLSDEFNFSECINNNISNCCG